MCSVISIAYFMNRPESSVILVLRRFLIYAHVSLLLFVKNVGNFGDQGCGCMR